MGVRLCEIARVAAFCSAFAGVLCCALDVFAIQAGPRRILSTNGSDRATRLVQSNKIVSLDDKTHVTWLDFDNKVQISSLDKDTGVWSATKTIGIAQDNHGPAALSMDSDGYLHAIFGPHNNTFQYAVSAQPNDSSNWVLKPNFGTTYSTYPSFVIDEDDTIHMTYRGSGSTLFPLSMMYQKLPKGGTWSTPRTLAASGPGYANYAHYHQSMAIGPSGELHLAYNIYRFDNPSPHDRATGAGYLTSIDGGATWKTIDGTVITQPVQPSSNVFFRTTTAPNGLSTNNVVVDSQNHPYISVWDYNDQAFSTSYLYHHDGSEWLSYKLNDLLPPSAAGMNFNADFTVGLDAADGVYIAGNLNNKVAVLYSPDLDTTPFELLIVDTPGVGVPAQGINIERVVGHNEIVTPRISYYFGTDANPSTVYSVPIIGPLDPQLRTWVLASSGNWNSTTSWSPAGIPNGNNHRVTFGPFNSAASTVILDTNTTVNLITFNSSRTYAIAGTGELTFAGEDAGIVVQNGNHQLQVRVTLANDTSFDAPVGSLELNNEVDLAGHTLTTLGNVNLRNSIIDSVGGGALINGGMLMASGMSTLAGDLVSVGELGVDILDPAIGASDMFDVLGSASLRGSVSVDVAGNYRPTDDITILTATEGISLIGDLSLTGPDARFFRGLSVVGNSLVLQAVPEPAALILVLIAFGFFCSYGRAVRLRPDLQMRPVVVGERTNGTTCGNWHTGILR
jgi:hypothetical protein